jgi:hypothetical protein
MKKVFFLLIGATLTIGAMAQDSTRKAGMKDLRKDIRDKRADKVARAADIKAGDKTAAKAETADIKADKKDIQGDKKTLQSEGVKHPIRRADRQIRKAKAAKKNG